VPFSATRDMWLVIKARDESTRAMRSFSRDIRMVGDSVEQANLRAARSALANRLTTQRLSGATREEMLATQGQIVAIDRQISAQKVARAATEEHRVATQRLSSAASGAAASLGILGIALTAVGVVGSLALKHFIDFSVGYQKQAALTRTQVDGLKYSVRQLEDVGIRVAQNVAVPFEQVQPALYDLFSSMEINITQAEDLLTKFSKAAVAGGTDVTSVSRATIGFLNAFHLPLSQTNHLLDVQFQLVQEGIGTYDEWVKRVGLATPSAARYGQSIEMLSAALAASTRMGITAARSTTAVSRAMDAMSNPKAVLALKQMGIAVVDAKGNFRPMIDVLTEFRTALQKVPKADRIKKILEVFKGAGGTIEARRFLQNMLLLPGNIEMFKAIFDEMTKTSGSFEAAYGVMADTTATKTQMLSNHWAILKVTVGEALIPSFLKVIKFVQGIIDSFNKLDPKTKTLIANILAISVGLSIVLGVITLVVAGLAGFIAVVAVAGSTLFITLGVIFGVIAALAAFGAIVTLAWKRSARFRDVIRDTIRDGKRLYTEALLPAAKAIWEAWQKYMEPALYKLYSILNEKVLPVFQNLASFARGKFVQAVKETVNWIKEALIVAFQLLGDVIKRWVIPVIDYLIKFYNAHQDTIKQVISWIMFGVKWFMKFGVIIAAVVVVAIVALIGVMVIGIAIFIALVIVLIKVIEWVKMLIKWFRNFGDHMDWVWSKIKGAWSAVLDFFGTVGDKIGQFLSGLIESMLGIGVKVIRGLINGMQSMLGELRSFFVGLGTSVLKWLGNRLSIGSPSKEFAKLGMYSAQGYIQGWKNAMPSVMNQMSASVGGMKTTVINPATRGSGGINQNFYINTQEINPRRHSAELGFLIASRS
jgi:TP901 family phage tail tape measure protein